MQRRSGWPARVFKADPSCSPVPHAEKTRRWPRKQFCTVSREYRGEGPPLGGSDQTGDWGSVNTLMAREPPTPDGCTCARFI